MSGQRKTFEGLLKKLRAAHAEPADACAGTRPIDPEDPLLCRFVFAFLLWEATLAHAQRAMQRIAEYVVDFNEFRVCLPDELARLIGREDPMSLQRAARIRAALQDLYRRHHAVSLTQLAAMPKRHARAYIESIDGVPPFVSSRLLLLHHDTHVAPMDSRIHRVLVDAALIDPEMPQPAAATWVERQVKAGSLVETYNLLQAEADTLPFPPAPPPGSVPLAPPEPSRSARTRNVSEHATPPAKKPRTKSPPRDPTEAEK